VIKGSNHTIESRNKIKETRSKNKTNYKKYIPEKKKPIYELPYGIKVLHENYTARYVMCRIEAHSLFPNSKITPQSRQYIQRSRVVMTAALGRPLAFHEHVHHINEDEKHNDDLDNLEILWSDEHNRHHKLGTKHTDSVKKQIGESLRKAYNEGRKVKSLRSQVGENNNFYGKIHSEQTKQIMREKALERNRKRREENGKM